MKCQAYSPAFDISSITVEGNPHKIIPAEIADNLHLAQYQLIQALNSDIPKGRFSDPMMIRRNCLVAEFLLEFFELVGNTATDLSIDLQSELLKARQIISHDKTYYHYNLGYSNSFQMPYVTKYHMFGSQEYFNDNRMDGVNKALPLKVPSFPI